MASLLCFKSKSKSLSLSFTLTTLNHVLKPLFIFGTAIRKIVDNKEFYFKFVKINTVYYMKCKENQTVGEMAKYVVEVTYVSLLASWSHGSYYCPVSIP